MRITDGKDSLSRFNMLLPAILLVALFPLTRSAFSQHAGYRLYTVDDGLVQSEVTALFQDSFGFLWIGTKHGISRFDGHRFETIRDSAGVSQSWVTEISQPTDTTLFILSRNGVIWYTYGNRNVRIRSWPITERFQSIWTDRGYGWMILGDSAGFLARVDENGPVRLDSELADKINSSVTWERWHTFTFSSRDRRLYFKTDSGALACIDSLGHVRGLNVPSFDRMFIGYDRSVYVLTPDVPMANYLSDSNPKFLDGFNPGVTEQVRILKISGDSIETVLESEKGTDLLESNLLVVNRDSIFISQVDPTVIHWITNRNWLSSGLDIPAVNAIVLDHEGNLWLGSAQGLLRIFPLALLSYDHRDGLYRNLQYIGQDNKGQMIAGSYDQGIQRLSGQSFIPVPISGLKPGVEAIIYPGGGKDRYGNLHICANNYTYLIWDGERAYVPGDVPITAGLSFYEDSVTNRQYYGTNYGLLIRSEHEKGYRLKDIQPGGVLNKVVAISKDPSGRIWLGGFRGLSYLIGDSARSLPDAQFPYRKGANSMVTDHRGTIWIGNAEGLWTFANDRFEPVENPWFTDLVVSLALVDTSMLVIGGIHGVGFLDLHTYYTDDSVAIRFFNRNNGFTGRECQQNAVCVDHNGMVWVAGISSLMRVDPKTLPDEPDPPPVWITRISVTDASMNPLPVHSSPLTQEPLTLSYDQRNLRFDFTAIRFLNEEYTRFRYRLEGQDPGWSPPVTDRYAVYTNLSPGEYTFQVLAGNESGVWNQGPASVKLIIRPAFWQTWWFFLLAGIAGIALVSGITWMVNSRIRSRRQKELEQQKTMAELQFRTLRNQLAPHFIFNALNAIGSTIYRHDTQRSYDLLHKFSRLIRLTLIHADKSSRTLAEEIEFVKYYLEIEKIRFEGRIDYQLHVGERVMLSQPVPRMIIQTFVENAVKHGLMYKSGDGLITIDISSDERTTSIVIIDNGIGRAAAAEKPGESTGKGMEIIREFIRLFNTFNPEKITVTVEDLHKAGQPTGTRVTVKIPRQFSYTIHETGTTT